MSFPNQPYLGKLKIEKNNYCKYLQTSPCICRWVLMYRSMYLYPKKTFILITFWSPSDAASILKIPRIDAAIILKNIIKN
jgi:hypothetical protein